MTGESLLDLVRQGGIVLYPLLLCSIVSVTVILERTWTIIRESRQAHRLQQHVAESWDDQNLAETIAICRRDPSALAGVFFAALTSSSAPEVRERTALRKLGETSRRLRRYIWLLGTIGSLAPFIGLLGTVVGIIRAFESMAATGSGGFAVVAAGISEALIATAGGLLVGVLSIFAYNAFQVRINTLTAEWREQTDALLMRLAEAPRPSEIVHRVVQSR